MGLLDAPLSVDIPRKQYTRRLEATANSLLKDVKPTRRGKRSKHKRKIPNMNYQQYMGSAYWKKRKNDYFGKFKKFCAICKISDGVTLHHKRYDVKFGAEPDDALVALCKFHHHEFHLHHKLRENMTKATDNFVTIARDTHDQFISAGLDDLSWI